MVSRIALLLALAFVLALAGAGARPATASAATTTDTQGDADCSGEVNAGDAIEDLRVGDGIESPGSCANEAGDVDCDGDLDGMDALAIVSTLAALPVTVPAGCLPVGVALANPPTSEQLIAAALQAGDIDYETSLLYRAYALVADSQLPEEYQSDVIDAQAWMDFSLEIDQNQATLSQGLLDQLVPWRVRPADPLSVFNYPAGVQAAADPASEWNSDLIAGGKVRLWVKGTYALADVAAAEGAINALWGVMPTYFRRPDGDVPDNPLVNPDEAFDIYLMENSNYDPRAAKCESQPLTCVLRASYGRGSAAARTTEPSSGRTASAYGIIGDSPTGAYDYFIRDVATVLFYSAEFAYDIYENHWITKTTVDWGGYEFSKALGRHDPYYNDAFSDFILSHPEKSLTRNIDAESRPGSWVYLLFATMKKSDVVKEMWQVAAAGDVQGSTALDQVFPFHDNFAEFAKWNWNQKPPLQQVYWDSDRDPTFLRAQPQTKDHHIKGPVTEQIPASLAPVSAVYHSFDFARQVRQITFNNKAIGTADLHVWALYKIGGQWKPPEDWTNVATKRFCRNDPDQNVTQLVIIISNSSGTSGTTPAEKPEVVTKTACTCSQTAPTASDASAAGVRDLPCAYEGTATATWRVDNEHEHTTTTATATGLRFELDGQPSNGAANYAMASGSVTVVASGTSDECSVSGGSTLLFGAETIDQSIGGGFYISPEDWYDGQGDVVDHGVGGYPNGPIVYTCPNGTSRRDYDLFFWLTEDNDGTGVPPTFDDINVLAGSRTQDFGDGETIDYEWDLHAVECPLSLNAAGGGTCHAAAQNPVGW